jgi:hypothetical protein
MEIKEIINNLNAKLKEIKNLRNLNAKEPRFKSWHVSTVALLKSLPGIYFKDVCSFKKLTFTDTKYHRDKKVYNTSDIDKYNSDLVEAENVLKRIISAGQKNIQTEKKNKSIE